MSNLLAAAAFFLGIHLFVSGTRLRDAIVSKTGEGPYMGLFSLASVGGLVWLGFAYAGARGAPGNEVIWGLNEATRGVQFALQFLAFLLVVLGLASPNPTAVRQDAALDRPDVVRGVMRITRHPFLWGVAVWAIGHLLVNGDAASLILFGSMLVLAIFGTVMLDAKKLRQLGSRYAAFTAQTSNAPFLAIIQRRQRLSLGEIGWVKLLIAVAVYVALVFAHPYFTGVPVVG